MLEEIITGRNETHRKQLNYLEVKCMRILKGWTDEERKELEEAKDNDSSSAMGLINDIGDDYDYCQSLTRKYIREDINDNNQMAKDIIDFYCDKAKFAEPKKYYVQLIKGDCYSYLNINPNGGAKLYNRLGLNGWKVKFTIDEVVAMNPKLLLFMEEVEK